MGVRELLPVEIVEALKRGATVVTGNQRAARTVRRAFDRRNRDLRLESWRPAAVMAWETWTTGLWRELLVRGEVSELLLNRTQEHAVWRGILEGDSELASLRSFDSMAEMAAEAWRRLCSYRGQGRLRGAAVSADTRAFQRWVAAFERKCRAEGLLSQALLEDRLRAEVLDGSISFEGAELVLVGFDTMTPAQMDLVEAVRTAWGAVRELSLRVEGKRFLVEMGDEHEELAAAARWVRGVVEEEPGARVAVIVPRLEEQRAEIDRVFRDVLAPELENIEASGDGPYEFSVGVMLAATPMVAVALDVLRWATEALPVERVSGLLLSPYFAMAEEERGTRAEFDAFELRKARMLRPEISLDFLIELVEGARRRSRLVLLLSRLRDMRSVVASRIEGEDRRTYAEWAERMRELLEAAGWGKGVDSREFQIRRKWEGALDELAKLDFDGAKVGFERALERLERIAGETTFAPESRDAPVQVMGPLEAAGTTFDAVWFLRGGDLSWPVAASGSPLLPWQMQRELEMPGVDVARDREVARRITERIAESAGRVVFSYAKETADGRQRPSPLLEQLELEELEIAPAEVEHSSVAVETVEDGMGIQPLPDRVVRGGAQILKLQAACGFRAFAERRLGATEIEAAELGIDARESGNVIHKALELFWGEVQEQEKLKSMTQGQQEVLLRQCIAEALRKTAELSRTAWDEAYVAMQRDRLLRLLGAWLDLERMRPQFAVKLSEKNFEDVRIGPLRLSVRVDRVDVTAGGELLIDYKTGAASPNDWLTERPDAPQLPLYAVLSENEVKGVAFGLVRAGKEMGLKGYAGEDEILVKASRMKMPMEMQVEEWRRVLERLASAFHAGDARVAPKNYPTTCRHCAQRELCRLDVSVLELNDDEDGSEVSGG
ncbi:MAG TPA: PD-(D/E)XK nuclease family protein [Edaphobacter sp.]